MRLASAVMPSLLIAQNHTALMTSLLCCLHGPACARLCSFQRTAGCFASHVQGVTTPASTSHTVAGRSRLLLRHHISQVQARGASSDAAAAAAVHNQPGPAADARRRAASASARRPTRQPPPLVRAVAASGLHAGRTDRAEGKQHRESHWSHPDAGRVTEECVGQDCPLSGGSSPLNC